MSFVTWFSYFVGLWASVYLADVSLRMLPYTKQRYCELSARMGISFDVLQARLFTRRFNRLFQFISSTDSIPWKLWFSCGVIFCTISMVFSVFILSLSVYNTFLRKPTDGQMLTPVFPGVNLPLSHTAFYILTLLLCAFLHEAGHALAALRERVRLHGFGLFLFGFYPGAYVDLSTMDLQSLSPFRQLRVYCAGVWHNAVIAVIGIGLIYIMPFVLSPGYVTGGGVGVTYLREDSVVVGRRGLSIGDAITRVNSCPVRNQSDWFRCLEEAQTRPSGYCLPGSYLNSMVSGGLHPANTHGSRRNLAAVARPLEELDGPNSVHVAQLKVQTSTDCCVDQSASTHLCFMYSLSVTSKSPKYACLPVRAVTECATCQVASDCSIPTLLRVPNGGTPGGAISNAAGDSIMPAGGAAGIAGLNHPRSVMCLVPSPPDNQTRLVRLVHNRRTTPAILFLGPLEDLVYSIGVSDYISKWPSVLPTKLPDLLKTFCTYVFSLSGALVILNVVPCYALDGQWILQALVDLSLSGCLPCRKRRRTIYNCILFWGTVLLLTNLILALWYFILDIDVANLPNLPSASVSSNG